jgi:hypothetical protein
MLPFVRVPPWRREKLRVLQTEVPEAIAKRAAKRFVGLIQAELGMQVSLSALTVAIDRDNGDQINDPIIGIVCASRPRVAQNAPLLMFAMSGQAVPHRTGAVPEDATVGTQKAGISTDNELEAAILLADDASCSLIVRRAKGQNCFTIDFRNVGFHCASTSGTPQRSGYGPGSGQESSRA